MSVACVTSAGRPVYGYSSDAFRKMLFRFADDARTAPVQVLITVRLMPGQIAINITAFAYRIYSG